MYMIRAVYNCKRGKASDIVAAFKTLNQALMSNKGFANGRIYVDMTGRMDTVIYQFEAESLDQFYKLERGLFVNIDAATQRLIDALNEQAVAGYREIYEVIL